MLCFTCGANAEIAGVTCFECIKEARYGLMNFELLRYLLPGEAIHAGDDWRTSREAPWQKVGLGIAAEVPLGGTGCYARKIRLESAMWRWLDVGEVVNAGDEMQISAGFGLHPPEDAEAVVEFPNVYRRRTVPVEAIWPMKSCSTCPPSRRAKLRDGDTVCLDCGKCWQGALPSADTKDYRFQMRQVQARWHGLRPAAARFYHENELRRIDEEFTRIQDSAVFENADHAQATLQLVSQTLDFLEQQMQTANLAREGATAPGGAPPTPSPPTTSDREEVREHLRQIFRGERKVPTREQMDEQLKKYGTKSTLKSQADLSKLLTGTPLSEIAPSEWTWHPNFRHVNQGLYRITDAGPAGSEARPLICAFFEGETDSKVRGAAYWDPTECPLPKIAGRLVARESLGHFVVAADRGRLFLEDDPKPITLAALEVNLKGPGRAAPGLERLEVRVQSDVAEEELDGEESIEDAQRRLAEAQAVAKRYAAKIAPAPPDQNRLDLERGIHAAGRVARLPEEHKGLKEGLGPEATGFVEPFRLERPPSYLALEAAIRNLYENAGLTVQRCVVEKGMVKLVTDRELEFPLPAILKTLL